MREEDLDTSQGASSTNSGEAADESAEADCNRPRGLAAEVVVAP